MFLLFFLQAVPGDSLHPRLLSLRAAGRDYPLTFQLDSDDLYDIVSKVKKKLSDRTGRRSTRGRGTGFSREFTVHTISLLCMFKYASIFRGLWMRLL